MGRFQDGKGQKHRYAITVVAIQRRMDAKTQKLIAHSLGESPIIKEVGKSADMTERLNTICAVLNARDVTTKATEQSLSQRVEEVARREAAISKADESLQQKADEVARREAAASKAEESLQQRADTVEKRLADAQHKAGLAEGQRSVYQDLAKSAEVERVKLSEEHGRWEILSREANSQLMSAKEQQENIKNEQAELSERKGGLDERERQLNKHEKPMVR